MIMIMVKIKLIESVNSRGENAEMIVMLSTPPPHPYNDVYLHLYNMVRCSYKAKISISWMHTFGQVGCFYIMTVNILIYFNIFKSDYLLIFKILIKKFKILISQFLGKEGNKRSPLVNPSFILFHATVFICDRLVAQYNIYWL